MGDGKYAPRGRLSVHPAAPGFLTLSLNHPSRNTRFALFEKRRHALGGLEGQGIVPPARQRAAGAHDRGHEGTRLHREDAQRLRSQGRGSITARCARREAWPAEVRFAADSPLEGDGFELPVPRTTPGFWPISTRTTRRDRCRKLRFDFLSLTPACARQTKKTQRAGSSRPTFGTPTNKTGISQPIWPQRGPPERDRGA
jgi:hypothetical protein